MPSKMVLEIANKKTDGFRNPFQSFDYREFVCGCGAAVINITVTYPIYKMIFRQVRKAVERNPLDFQS